MFFFSGAPPAIPKQIYDSVMKCSMSSRKEMYQNIFCIGGTTLSPGFEDRMVKELSKHIPSTIKPKVISLNFTPYRPLQWKNENQPGTTSSTEPFVDCYLLCRFFFFFFCVCLWIVCLNFNLYFEGESTS